MHIDEIEALRAKGTDAKIDAVCDLWAPRRKLAQARSKRVAETDWRALVVRADLDGMIVATPDYLHAPMTLAALENGKDVYCESPATLTLDEAAAVRDAARNSARIYQAGATTAAQIQWRAAQSLIQSGRLGAPLISHASVKAWRLSALNKFLVPLWVESLTKEDALPSDADRFFQWRAFSEFSDGPMAAAQFNAIAAFLIATGGALPERVVATGGRFNEGPGDNPDRVAIRAEYADGHRIVIDTLNPFSEDRAPVTRLEHAAVEYHGYRLSATRQGLDTKPFARRFGSGESKKIKMPRSASPLENWLDCMRTREPCICNEDLAYQAMAALSTGTRALRERKALDLG